MNRSRMKSLLTQGVLALLLLISPVSNYAGSSALGHPKIHTEWVSILRKPSATHHKADSKQVSKAVSYVFIPRSVLRHTTKPIQKPIKNLYWLFAAHQKTIPSGIEDELIA